MLSNKRVSQIRKMQNAIERAFPNFTTSYGTSGSDNRFQINLMSKKSRFTAYLYFGKDYKKVEPVLQSMAIHAPVYAINNPTKVISVIKKSSIGKMYKKINS